MIKELSGAIDLLKTTIDEKSKDQDLSISELEEIKCGLEDIINAINYQIECIENACSEFRQQPYGIKI